MPDHMPEDMPDRMPNRMSEDMSDRMPEDINVMVGITRSKVIDFFVNPGPRTRHVCSSKEGVRRCTGDWAGCRGSVFLSDWRDHERPNGWLNVG